MPGLSRVGERARSSEWPTAAVTAGSPEPPRCRLWFGHAFDHSRIPSIVIGNTSTKSTGDRIFDQSGIADAIFGNYVYAAHGYSEGSLHSAGFRLPTPAPSYPTARGLFALGSKPNAWRLTASTRIRADLNRGTAAGENLTVRSICGSDRDDGSVNLARSSFFATKVSDESQADLQRGNQSAAGCGEPDHYDSAIDVVLSPATQNEQPFSYFFANWTLAMTYAHLDPVIATSPYEAGANMAVPKFAVRYKTIAHGQGLNLKLFRFSSNLTAAK